MEGTGGKQNTMDGAKQLNGARTVEGSGHGRQRWQQANKKPAEQATAGGHSRQTLRPAQASKNKRMALSWPASQQKRQLQMTSASRRAGKWGECKGVGTEEGGLRPT